MDDEPFWLAYANLLTYDRRLNMRAGHSIGKSLETPTGKQVLITSRRLVLFANRHVAAISYRVTLVNADAHMVISSEMAVDHPSRRTDQSHPRQMRIVAGPVLQHRLNYANDRRIVLCHSTQQSRLTLTCATDQALETSCNHAFKAVHTEDFGQVAFTVEATRGYPVHLIKYLVYHTSPTASPQELCGRAEWTMDRITAQGFQELLTGQQHYMGDFCVAAMSVSRMLRRNARNAPLWRSSKLFASTFFRFCRPPPVRKTQVCGQRAHWASL